jgi:hypothetical protein
MLLENIIVTQLEKEFNAFYGTRRFITAIRRVRLQPDVSNHCSKSEILNFMQFNQTPNGSL